MTSASFYLQEALTIRQREGLARAIQYLFALRLNQSIDQAQYNWMVEAVKGSAA